MSDVQSGLPNQRPIPSGKYKVTVNDFINKNDINIGSNDVTFVFDNAIFNDYRSIKISGDGNITIVCNTFSKSNNGDIDFANNNLKFYSQNFELSSSTSIKTEGKVEIFNKNNFSISGPVTFSIGKDFTLYNQNDFTLSSDPQLTVLGEVKIFNKDELDFKEKAKLSSEENVTIYSKGRFSQENSAGITSAKNLNIFSNSVVLSSDMTMTINNEMNVYAYTTFEADNTIKINSKKNNIFYKGDITPKFNGKFQNPINLDFLNSSLNLGGSTSITGNIILRGENNTQTKNTVTINGGSNNTTPLYLYAPQFNISLEAGVKFNGSIIGNNVDVTNANITYKQPPPNNGGSTGGSTGSGQIDSSLTPNSDGGSIEID